MASLRRELSYKPWGAFDSALETLEEDVVGLCCVDSNVQNVNAVTYRLTEILRWIPETQKQIGDEVVEMERKHEILIGILREVTSECSHCKVEVARRLSRVTDKTETIVVPN